MPKSLRTIITDDHKVLVNGIYDLLKIVPEVVVVGNASSPEGLKQLLRNQNADLLILDYRLGGPAEETHDLVKWLASNRPELKTIMYSSNDVSKFFKKEYSNTIQAYVLKNDEPEELIQAIKAVAAGKTFQSSSIGNKTDKVSKHDDFESSEKAKLLVNALSPREKEILIHIAQGHTNKKIGELLFIAEDTVKAHRRSLKKKLGAKTTIDLQKIAQQAGLLD